jgi:hypothetical protein
MSQDLVKILQLENTISDLKKEIASLKSLEKPVRKTQFLAFHTYGKPVVYGDSALLKKLWPDCDVGYETGWGHHICSTIPNILETLEKNGFKFEREMINTAPYANWHFYSR